MSSTVLSITYKSHTAIVETISYNAIIETNDSAVLGEEVTQYIRLQLFISFEDVVSPLHSVFVTFTERERERERERF